MNSKLHYVIIMTMFFLTSVGFGQKNFFTKINNSQSVNKTGQLNTYQIDNVSFRNQLSTSPKRENVSKNSNMIMEFPTVSGKMQAFRIVEASVMSPELQALYPEIRSYAGYSVSDASFIRFSISPYNGLNGIILGGDNVTVFEADKNNLNRVFVADKSSNKDMQDFECKTIDDFNNQVNSQNANRDADDSILRTYRLAMSVTGEYSAFHGGNLPAVNAAINTTLTAVNAVFENDFNVTMVLVANNNNVVYLNGATDPYSSTTDANYSSVLASTLDTNIGQANYDIGHLMAGIGNNGFAGCIGCVCSSGTVATLTHKGSGYTTSTNPISSTFDIDFVAHEMGHQFGANHTFTHASEGGIAQMEPGSGSTIMGYAGITGSTDVQSNSDPYFHAVSIQQVTNHITLAATCSVNTNTGNTTPTVNAGSDLTLPIGTAFRLTGVGNDVDGDAITFCWEQFDENNGTGGGFPNPALTNSNLPLFRSYLPTTNPVRTFPKFEDLVANGVNGNVWEKVPTVQRFADFRLTVRDNRLGGANNTHDDMRVTFSSAHGPFAVTSQSTSGVMWESGTTETITWNVNNTTALAGSTNVNILLSIDGGLTFPTVLASNVPNNGTYNITVPNTPAPYCRILIEPTANVYFAVNLVDFAIDYEVTTVCNQYSSSPNVAITDNGDNFTQVDQIIIPDSSVISDINIGVNITHTYIGDLILAVLSPDGTEIRLMNPDDCESEDNLIVKFDDSGSVFNCAISGTNQTYKPLQGELSSLNGENIAGNWLLGVGDFYAQDTGTFNSWYVEVCETTATPLSINENEFTGFSIFPNPNNGEFTIKLNSNSGNDIKVDVYDVRGRMIFNNVYSNTPDFTQTINLNNVQSGMYLVNVNDGRGQVTKKIIVE